jgi:hypothetical protein
MELPKNWMPKTVKSMLMLKNRPLAMSENRLGNAFLLGLFIFLGLSTLGYLLGQAAIQYRLYDRSVTVKGLSEQEYKADIVIWPIQFNNISNDLKQLYDGIDKTSAGIKGFLVTSGIAEADITFSSPKIAQQYGNAQTPKFRFPAFQTVTVYSNKIAAVRDVMRVIIRIG